MLQDLHSILRNWWVRNRADENRPGDIRPNQSVYTCVGTRVSTHVSTRVGAFVWDYNTEKASFWGHSRVHLREHSHEHLQEPFVGALVGHISLSPALCILRNWADPGVLWKKAPRAMRAMRGKTLETVPFQPYFGCTKSFLKVLSN